MFLSYKDPNFELVEERATLTQLGNAQIKRIIQRVRLTIWVASLNLTQLEIIGIHGELLQTLKMNQSFC